MASLNRPVDTMISSASSVSDSLAYNEGDIEEMFSEAADLHDLSREVLDLYRDFVEMCVHLRTSITWVDVGYQWTEEGDLDAHPRRHPDPRRNLGTVLLGGVHRIGNDGGFPFFIGNLGRSYPHVVVHPTRFVIGYSMSFCVHVREYDPTLPIYDLRSVLSLTQGSMVVPDIQRL